MQVIGEGDLCNLIPVLAHILANRKISTIGAHQKTASMDVFDANYLLLNIQLKVRGK